MIAYVDSSVVLRIALVEPNPLAEWRLIRRAVVSALVQVECLRTMDRLRIRRGLPVADAAIRRAALFRALAGTEVVEPDQRVLARASQPMSAPLGTLDAIHLATALLWREKTGVDPIMATHDVALALAARASGLHVLGA